MRFIDFEYFGWDDPVKLVSDTAIHPGSSFAESSAAAIDQSGFRASLKPTTPRSLCVETFCIPLFGTIWCLIILNDYLPERRSRRVVAARSGDFDCHLAGQLDKARRLHQTICERDPDLAPR